MSNYIKTEYQQKLFYKRFAQRNLETNELLENTAEDMFYRLSTKIVEANDETDTLTEDSIFEFLKSRQGLFAGRILTNVGGNGTNMSGNCFTLPIEDSRQGIMKCQTDTVEIHAAGGGTGTNFSSLRPKGDIVKKVRGESSGPCPFLDGFDAYAQTIKQGGSRRAARMSLLNAEHPDIYEFIDAKKDHSRWTTTNISVGARDRFMEAVVNKEPWDLQFNGKVYKTIEAYDLFHDICTNAHENAEPGFIFLDTINKKYPLRYLYKIDASNPCGERPQPNNSMCILGSLILSSFVKKDKTFNWNKFSEAVKLFVQMLDNIIDISSFPIPEVEEMVKKTRPIGVGVMGFADALFMMEIPYGDNAKCLKFTEDLGCKMYKAAKEASEEIASRKGSFPDYDKEKADFPPRRNATLLSIAPTGTIAPLAGVSYGIEPHFASSVLKNETLGKDVISNPVLDGWLEESETVVMPDWARFVITDNSEHLLDVMDHLAPLRVLAKYVDAGISKTVNLPKTATVEDIETVYLYMWKKGIKGGTVYRDGCRKNQPLNAEKSEEDEYDVDDNDEIEFIDLIAHPREVPDVSPGMTYPLKYNPTRPTLWITICDDDDGPIQIFFHTYDSIIEEALKGISTSMTTSFRRGTDVSHLISQWKKVESANGGGWFDRKYVPSMLAGIAMVIEKHFKLMEYIEENKDKEEMNDIINTKGKIQGERCPECGMYTLVYIEGCQQCISSTCSYSKCG